MNRRQFFTRAAVAAAGLMVAEQELWRPSQSIFLPPRGGWGARSTVELWRTYGEKIRPAALALEVGVGGLWSSTSDYTVCEDFGSLSLYVSPTISPSVERAMRCALLAEPRVLGLVPTYRDFLPWLDLPASRPGIREIPT